MFEVSWGELFVVTGLGLALIGKKDLPKAAGFVGNRMGRMVGLLQGARARAETFAQETELKALHNELKSGLRELDAVKSELATTMSSRGMVGRGLLSSSSRTTLLNTPSQPTLLSQPLAPTTSTAGAMPAAPTGKASTRSAPTPATAIAAPSHRTLPPISQTVAAVAEDQWEQQGIGFVSKAERGVGLGFSHEQQKNSGSAILASIYQQNLIFDQYDRVVQEQDAILQSKIAKVQQQVAANSNPQQQQQQSTVDDRNSPATEADKTK